MKKTIFFFSLIATLQLSAQDQTINGTTFKQDGKVGVGTINPQKRLHINASNDDGVALGSGNAILGDIGTGTFTQLLFWNGSNVYYGRSATGAGVNNHYFRTQGTDRMAITSSGNIGIGTTTPTTRLHITDNRDGLLTFQTSDNTWLYTNWLDNTGSRRLWMGLGADLSSFNINLENSTNKILLNGGDVGVGTTTPSAKLHVNGTIKGKDYITVDKGGSYRVGLNGQSHGYISGRNDSLEKKFLIHSNGNTWFNGGNVGIGTITPDSKLTVAGNIQAQEVKVTVNAGADFVFAEDYNLPDLKTLENYIKKHKHLPEIASEKEMQANGIHLAEMNIKLLQKIEELTLYTIEQDKVLENQKNINKSLETRLTKLEKYIQKINTNTNNE